MTKSMFSVVTDLHHLEKRIQVVEAYIASEEFKMLREITQQDYRDWLNGMKLRMLHLRHPLIRERR